MDAEEGTPLVYRCSLERASSELTAPILKSLGILEREPFIFLCGIFFSGSDHVPLRYSAATAEESISKLEIDASSGRAL